MQKEEYTGLREATADTIIIDFPMRGDGWTAVLYPAHKVPSHGNHSVAQTYAYDFAKVDWDRLFLSTRFWTRKSSLSYWLTSAKPSDFYTWAESVFAPCDGAIVTASDGWPDHDHWYPLIDSAIALCAKTNSRIKDYVLRRQKRRLWRDGTPSPEDYRCMAGNYIILKSASFFVFFAHLQANSLRVASGDHVERGQHLANLGNSGTSGGPHLHFQLMDSADLFTAKGLPCAFTIYESLVDGSWRTITNGIPGRYERIRLPDV